MYYLWNENKGTVIEKTAGLSTKPPNLRNVRRILQRKINPEKCPVFLGDLVLNLWKIAHISCIFSVKFAVFTECGNTSIQTKQSPVIFVWQFSFLSDKIFQSVGQLSGNISEDFAKTEGTDQLRGYREADLRLCFRICNSIPIHVLQYVIHVEK